MARAQRIATPIGESVGAIMLGAMAGQGEL